MSGPPSFSASAASSKLTALIRAPTPKPSSNPTVRRDIDRRSPRIAPRTSDDEPTSPQSSALATARHDARAVRVLQTDPSAFTPPYDHALCTGLARLGEQVVLATSRFGYGDIPPARGYLRDERAFYRLQPGAPGSRVRLVAKLAQHVPDMLRLRRRARAFDVAHFQWLAVQHVDRRLLPRSLPVVLTPHDV